MHLKTRNVNTCFREMIGIFQRGTDQEDRRSIDIVKRQSRNGPVLMIDEPVTITYSHPRERVLFNQARDANPFFHLYEALYMLAGRNDVAPLAFYNSKIRQYSDDEKTFNGAYGYRWRKYNDGRRKADVVDQLDILVDHLKADPTSRRAVLQMWNVEDDLLKISPTQRHVGHVGGVPAHQVMGPASKDVCCNLSVMFSMREVIDPSVLLLSHPPKSKIDRYLDMTVTNRSNDLIWGMLGANFVHFTILQEYMAAQLGVEVGVYNHFTNNLHVYENNWKPEEWLKDKTVPDGVATLPSSWAYNKHFPLVKDTAKFEEELPKFVDYFSSEVFDLDHDWEEPFLNDVAKPMLMAFHTYKRRSANAMMWTNQIKADDWKIAAQNWIEKRLKNKESQQCSET